MWSPIRRLIVAAFVAVAAGTASSALAADGLTGAHALSMFDDVKYGPDFEHFDYADPSAPAGGEIRLAALGTFDSLNPFILKGNAAAGSGLIYDNLLTGSLDEPFTEYGLLVESIDMPADRSWVEFTLREEARWHDGRPVTVEDVIWTTETLTTKGHPFYRHYYADIADVSQMGPRTVRFTFGDTVNRELPLIVVVDVQYLRRLAHVPRSGWTRLYTVWSKGSTGAGPPEWVLGTLEGIVDKFMLEYLRVRDTKECQSLRQQER